MFFDGWLNLDKVDMRKYLSDARGGMTGFPDWQRRFVERLNAGDPIAFVVLDVRGGLPFPDDSAEYVYAGQFIEHLNPVYEAPAFVKECRRVLKPGGILRMSTPDLNILLLHFTTNQMDAFASEQPEAYAKARSTATQLGYIMYGSLGPESTSENYEGHMMIYNEDSMTDLLWDAGFQDIAFFPANRSSDPVLQAEIVDMGVTHSLYVEARK